MLAMEATPSVPTMLRSSRPKLSAVKKKQKKLQQFSVRQSPQKNSTQVRRKGKMDKSQQLYEPLDIDEEDLHGGIEEMESKEGEALNHLLK